MGDSLVPSPAPAVFCAESVFCLKTACSCKPGSGAVLCMKLSYNSGCNVLYSFPPTPFHSPLLSSATTPLTPLDTSILFTSYLLSPLGGFL